MNSAIVSRSAAVALLWVASFARSAGGQARDGCEHVTSLTSLAPLSGSRIRSIAVVTLPPPALPGPAAMMDWVHVQTRGGTVRRQLLFTAGDTLDTLRVAETLRRLRRQRYLGAAVVDGVRCDGQSDVELTVTTRDEWSTKASLQVRSGARSGCTLRAARKIPLARKSASRVQGREETRRQPA